MEKPEFLKLVRDLVAYFERKAVPTSGTIDMWYQDVKGVDSEALGHILEALKQDERWPSNLPLAIKRAWSDWARSAGNQPSRREAVSRYHSCPDCERGVIFVRREDEWGNICGFAFACKRCGQCDTALPAAALGELLAKGYEENDCRTFVPAPMRREDSEWAR